MNDVLSDHMLEAVGTLEVKACSRCVEDGFDSPHRQPEWNPFLGPLRYMAVILQTHLTQSFDTYKVYSVSIDSYVSSYLLTIISRPLASVWNCPFVLRSVLYKLMTSFPCLSLK